MENQLTQSSGTVPAVVSSGGSAPSYEELVARLNQLAPLLREVDRRAEKEHANNWRPNSGEAFEITVDQEMWEAIRSAL